MKIRIKRKSAPKQAPKAEFTAAEIMDAAHPLHKAFRKWLEDRRAELGEESAQFNKRKARLYLAEFPSFKKAKAA